MIKLCYINLVDSLQALWIKRVLVTCNRQNGVLVPVEVYERINFSWLLQIAWIQEYHDQIVFLILYFMTFRSI